MALLNKLFTGTLSITFHGRNNQNIPLKFYAPNFKEAQRIAIQQAVAELIINESPALDYAKSVSLDLLVIFKKERKALSKIRNTK